MNLQRRLILEWFAIGLLASALALAIDGWRGTISFDNVLYDQLAGLDRPVADDAILIVAIDDAALAQVGKWPWSREIHAQVLRKLAAANPRSITVDILFSEASDPAADGALAEAISAAGMTFVPLHFVIPGSNGRDFDTQLPIPEIADAAAAIGHVNLELDEDGSVRRVALCARGENGAGETRVWPHLMELVYRGAGSNSPSRAYRRDDCAEPAMFPYAARGSFVELSYGSLINGEIPADMVAGRDVIIGATATGLGDNYPVPYADGGQLSGSEIMANMLNALRQDNFIRPLGEPFQSLMSLAPIWVLLLLFLFTSPRTALIASVATLAAILLGSAMLLAGQIWFAPSSALIGVLLIYPLWGWRRLQAVSSFMDRKLGELQRDDATDIFARPQNGANDLVGRQSASLGRAISQIRDLRQFVSDVIADLPDPMVVTNIDGRVTLASKKVRERLNNEIIGGDIAAIMAAVTAPADWPKVQAFLNKPIEAVDSAELIRFASVDGRSFVMRQSVALDDAGVAIGRISYFGDISQLAEAEAQREEVLQLLSHDMRAPQSAIIASLEGELDQTARSRIEQNARRTMRLAQDFVDIARMQESAFAGEDILLESVVHDVTDRLWPLAEERQVKIDVVEQAEEGFVLAEPDALSRGIENLLDNAIKFSPADSRITATLSRTEIDGAAYLSVAITDQGTGIDEDLLPHLFKRFVTVDTEQRRAKGSGLGLAYVETVVERHGGRIRAENRDSGGAKFTILLPEAIG